MKDNKMRFNLILFLVLGMVLAACSDSPFVPIDLDLAHTYAAATLSAIKTQETANLPTATQPNEELPVIFTQTAIPSPTVTLTSTAWPTQTFTPTPTNTATSTPNPTKTSTSTPTPTKTSTSTATPTKMATSTSTKSPIMTHTPTLTPTMTHTPTLTPTITQTPVPCNQAVFLGHVNFPVGSVVLAGAEFTKTWQVQNTGSCTWSTEYALVFASGNAMSAPLRIPLNEPVLPGETANLSIRFEAPGIENIYSGTWALVDSEGLKIPFDQTKNGNLTVSIRVNILDTVVIDFAESYCDASWRSFVVTNLPCSGDPDVSASGYVIRLAEGDLEDGTKVKKPILVTRPDDDPLDGFISGTYPSIKIQSGDHFLATIGCSVEGDLCDLIFELNYQIGTGPIENLQSWHEEHDGQVNEISVDLSNLAGENVKFILTIRNNGTSQDNDGFWFEPQIMR